MPSARPDSANGHFTVAQAYEAHRPAFDPCPTTFALWYSGKLYNFFEPLAFFSPVK